MVSDQEILQIPCKQSKVLQGSDPKQKQRSLRRWSLYPDAHTQFGRWSSARA